MSFFDIHKILKITTLVIFLASFCLFPAKAENNDLRSQIERAEKQLSIETNETTEEIPNLVVIELFTAPDCSACIYADRMLFDAMQKENVIGLSCYISPLASFMGENSKTDNQTIDQCIFRQWTYSKGTRSDYELLSTPEFILNGAKKKLGLQA